MQGVDAWVRVPGTEDRSNTACTAGIRILKVFSAYLFDGRAIFRHLDFQSSVLRTAS